MTDEKILAWARSIAFGCGLAFMLIGIGWIACGVLDRGVRDVIVGAVLTLVRGKSK
jgi:hypothetical protein